METRSWINECMIQLQNRHFRGHGVHGLQGSTKPSGNSHRYYQHDRCVVANILRRRTPSQNNNDPGCHRWCRGPSCCSHQVRIVFYRHPLFLVIAKFLQSFGGHSLSSRSGVVTLCCKVEGCLQQALEHNRWWSLLLAAHAAGLWDGT